MGSEPAAGAKHDKDDKTQDSQGSSLGVGVIDKSIGLVENVLYVGLCVVLVGGAMSLLVAAGYTLAVNIDDGTEVAVAKTLDRLLLTFILVELLGAVRATIREHKLIAEPFLIVGLIASIKEIIVILIDAKDLYGEEDKFTDSMTELGLIGMLVFVIAIASYLLRRKEREPEE